MSSSRRSRLLAVLFAIVSGFAAPALATQDAARRLEYQKALGPPITLVGGLPVYHPVSYVSWAISFYDRAPWAFEPGLRMLLIGVSQALGALAYAVRPGKRVLSSHGTAHWASEEEIKESGLLRNDGMILAQTYDAKLEPRRDLPEGSFEVIRPGRLLRYKGRGQRLVFAPPRTGKGAGIILPAHYTGPKGPGDNVPSIISYDMTGENWAKTAGFRKGFSHCLKFAPASLDTHRFNPLLEIRRGVFETADVQSMAQMVVEPGGAKDRNHWDDTAAELIAGVIMHVLYSEGEKSLPAVERFLSDPKRSLVESMELMQDTKHLGGGPHELCAAAAADMLNREAREQTSVLSSAKRHLSIFRDPVLSAALADSDFRLADLRDADKPVSLYLVVPNSERSRLRPIMRILLNQVFRTFTQDRMRQYKRELDIYLDEFTTLDRMECIESGLGFFGGFGIYATMVVQSLNQIEAIYPKNAILDNCDIKVTYTAGSIETARKISEWLGQATIENRWRRSIFSRPERPSEHGRPLLTPAEVTQLPSDEVIIFKRGSAPIRGKKVISYEMPCFRGLDKLTPPSGAAELGAQLPPPRGHDWLNVKASPAPARPKPKRPAQAVGCTPKVAGGAGVLRAGSPGASRAETNGLDEGGEQAAERPGGGDVGDRERYARFQAQLRAQVEDALPDGMAETPDSHVED